MHGQSAATCNLACTQPASGVDSLVHDAVHAISRHPEVGAEWNAGMGLTLSILCSMVSASEAESTSASNTLGCEAITRTASTCETTMQTD